jgi:hypothetical protein
MGPIQISHVNFGVPAPQTLLRQLRFDDDRTRAAALSSLGVPGMYLQHGSVAYPHSVELALVPLGVNNDVDALLTVEMDQHIVTAVLVPDSGNWRRIATLTFATPFANPETNPSTWLRTARSFLHEDKYRAIFHASSGSLHSPSFVESEAQLRILNDHAVVSISFASTSWECDLPPATEPSPFPATAAPVVRTPKPAHKIMGCEIVHRWLRPDFDQGPAHFELITGSGHLSPKEATAPFADSISMITAHLRNFSCQPFLLQPNTLLFEPAGPVAPCYKP